MISLVFKGMRKRDNRDVIIKMKNAKDKEIFINY